MEDDGYHIRETKSGKFEVVRPDGRVANEYQHQTRERAERHLVNIRALNRSFNPWRKA